VHVPSKESEHTKSHVKWETSHAKWDKIVKVRAALERYLMPFFDEISSQPTHRITANVSNSLIV
jgi:hypothetical protein